MTMIERLTPYRKRYFEELGIFRDEDIPSSFFDTIQSYSDNFSESERFCLNDYNISFCSKAIFSIRDVVGTNHPRYANKSWLEAFLDLDRGEKLLELYFNDPGYYERLKKEENCDIGLACKDGKFFILDTAGGGNNRMIIQKIKYLALREKNPNNISQLDTEMSYMGNVRVSPKEEIAKSIFELMFPRRGYDASGYQVINKSKIPCDDPLFDIVVDFPVDPKVVCENIDGYSLANFSKDGVDGGSKGMEHK